MDEFKMKIGELAAFFHVSPKAIRLYEKKGIIKPAMVDPQTGYRYYTADQVHTLNALLELKILGFSLAEIKTLLDGSLTDEKFLDILERKKNAWKDVVSNAENKIEAIDSIIQRISASSSAIKLHELSEEERAWLLVKMVCIEDVHGQAQLSEAIWL